MLSLTKKTEYAIIAVCHLAQAGDRVVSARGLAAAYAVRLPLLMNVLKMLGQRGLLRSIRGARGGYCLAVSPGNITLAALIEAVEGPVRLVRCAPPLRDERELNCALVGSCPISSPLNVVHQQLRAFLGDVTIADLLTNARMAAPHGPQEVIGVVAQ